MKFKKLLELSENETTMYLKAVIRWKIIAIMAYVTKSERA